MSDNDFTLEELQSMLLKSTDTKIPYKGLTFKMLETEHDVYTVNIINRSGKIIHVMKDIPHWEEAAMWGMGFIDGYLLRKSA